MQVSLESHGLGGFADDLGLALDAGSGSLVGGGHRALNEVDFEALGERLARVEVEAAHQGDGDALLADAARAARTVHVHRGVFGEAVVDDVRKVGDVDSTSSHVGGHEELGLAGFHASHHLFTLALGQLTADELRIEALSREVRGHGGGVFARVAEDDGAVGFFLVDDGQSARALWKLGEVS